MEKLNKKILVSALIALAVALIVACAPVTLRPMDPGIVMMNNDLAGGTVLFETDIEGESFALVTEFMTEYDSTQWLITDSKHMRIRAWLKPTYSGDPYPTEVFMEHVHCDVNLQATKAILDGWTQDTMDDSIHGSDQPGFYMDADTIYETYYVIEGYTETFIEGWSTYNQYYGYGDVSQNRPTDEELADNGVYGNRMVCAFDLALKHSGEDYYQGRGIVVEFEIPTKFYNQVVEDYYNSVATATAYAIQSATKTPEPE